MVFKYKVKLSTCIKMLFNFWCICVLIAELRVLIAELRKLFDFFNVV